MEALLNLILEMGPNLVRVLNAVGFLGQFGAEIRQFLEVEVVNVCSKLVEFLLEFWIGGQNFRNSQVVVLIIGIICVALLNGGLK